MIKPSAKYVNPLNLVKDEQLKRVYEKEAVQNIIDLILMTGICTAKIKYKFYKVKGINLEKIYIKEDNDYPVGNFINDYEAGALDINEIHIDEDKSLIVEAEVSS